MGELEVQVETLAFGTVGKRVPLRPVALNLAYNKLRIRDIISLAVEMQIQDLLEKQHLDAEEVKRCLHNQYLSPEDVKRQAEGGVVRMHRPKIQEIQKIDVEQEISHALDGFISKSFRVIVDGESIDSLDEIVVLTSESKITFLRLVQLAGG